VYPFAQLNTNVEINFNGAGYYTGRSAFRDLTDTRTRTHAHTHTHTQTRELYRTSAQESRGTGQRDIDWPLAVRPISLLSSRALWAIC
jgi:hypothetical protein